MEAPAIRYARAGDLEVRYWEMGTGPTLVHLAVPGRTFDDEWDGVDVAGWFERLAQHFRVCRVSVGTPVETVVGDDAQAQLVASIDLVLDALGAEECTIFAAAHACAQALVYAAARPARVGHMMLWNGYANGATYAATSALYQIRGVHAIDPALHGRMANLARGAQSWEELEQDEGFSTRVADWPERMEALERIDVRQAASQVKARVLLLHPPEAQFVGFEAVRELAGLVPDSSLHRPKGGGSQPWGRRPQDFVDQLAEFVGLETGTKPVVGDGGPPIRLVLFTDVEASTNLTDRLGDAEARALLREHERLTREALGQYGGTEIKTMGDGFMASFTSASGALDASIAMQRGLTEYFAASATPIRIRVGINAGEPIEEDDDLYGTAVIQAARVMGMADGGQILVTDTVRNLVAGKDYRFSDHGTHDLKGFEEPARLFEVAWEQ